MKATKPELKKFTVVLSGDAIGNYNSRITSYRHIEGTNANDAMERFEVNPCCVWFVFPGWQEPISEWDK